MKVEILKDCKASRDGVNLISFWEGDVISVSDSFSKVLIDAGYAGKCKESRIDPPMQTPEKQAKKPYKRRTS